MLRSEWLDTLAHATSARYMCCILQLPALSEDGARQLATDVGYLLNNWMSKDEVLEIGEGDQAPTAAGGFISREELSTYYAAETGRDLSGINYYRAFSHWRLAAIGQGVYKRYLVGAMGDNRDVDLERQKEGVTRRAQAALELLES